jgi:hypothetical protein
MLWIPSHLHLQRQRVRNKGNSYIFWDIPVMLWTTTHHHHLQGRRVSKQETSMKDCKYSMWLADMHDSTETEGNLKGTHQIPLALSENHGEAIRVEKSD